MDGRILIVVLLMLAFGCVAASQEKAATVDTGKPVVTTTGPMPVPGETTEEKIVEEVIAEEPEVVEEVPEEPIIETRSYTDPRGKITLEYPKTWTLKTETKAGSYGLTVEFIDVNYPNDKIRINYGATAETIADEEAKLENQGIDVTKLNINGQEFITYDTIFEPKPGKRIKERIAITIKNENVYKISLTASLADFDALLPSYEVVLESVQFP